MTSEWYKDVFYGRDIIADPNFLVIGAQKCGTSWLAKMIRQHPDVFASPRKELHFFNMRDNYSKGIKWYQNQFAGYNGEKAIGEFTPNYLWVNSDQREIQSSGSGRDIPKLEFEHYPELNPDIHKLVYQHYPDIKLVVSLRDPVKRAISCYYHHIRQRRIAPTSRIIEVGHKYGIISMGFYYSQLCKWLKLFTENQFLILIFEYDIVQNRAQTIRRVYRFLGVDEHFKPANLGKKSNVRSGHLYLYLHYYFPSLADKILSLIPELRSIDFPKIVVTDEEIKQLSRIYADENQKLESLLGISLPVWKHE